LGGDNELKGIEDRLADLERILHKKAVEIARPKNFFGND
jgi:hypothetical protein